jgi:hypothetical protein
MVFGRYVWNFVTPSFAAGLFGSLALTDFVIDVPVGVLTDGGRRGCDRNSAVFASVCELGAAPGHGFEFPFIGAAYMQVMNVAPRDDGIVSVWIHVNWLSPLHIRLNLLVVNGF